MVFQDYNLFPHLTVLKNVMEGPVHVLKEDKQTAKKRALELLDKVGLKQKATAYLTNYPVVKLNALRSHVH